MVNGKQKWTVCGKTSECCYQNSSVHHIRTASLVQVNKNALYHMEKQSLFFFTMYRNGVQKMIQTLNWNIYLFYFYSVND